MEQDPPEPIINNLLEFLSQDNQHPNLSRTQEIIEELILISSPEKNKKIFFYGQRECFQIYIKMR